MERKSLKLIRVLVVTLLCVTALPAYSQQKPKVDLDALAARGAVLAYEDPAASQLRNRQPDDLARRGFDIGMGAAEGQTLPGPGKQRIHDSLPLAEQEGFTAAVTFSLARNRKKITDMAPKGAEIASEDPLAMELRGQQPNGSVRLGFDIGMAAAEGQTLPGPGKQKIHDSLAEDEQRGFTIAVTFSLERNRNAELATKGAAIAEADPVVAEARNSETDVFYRLGFDIATGIFGDPKLGALGNTETGPGSLAIRDSLSDSGKRGFNASANVHLSRRYGRTTGNLTPVGESPTSIAVPSEPLVARESPYERKSDSILRLQPENSIQLNVSYRKEYGYKEVGTAFSSTTPNSCGAFSISATPTGPVDGFFGISIPVMRESNSKYVCAFLVTYLPLNQQIKVVIAMSNDPLSLTGIWLNGSEPQPPAGQQRTILNGSRIVTLTAAQPRARLELEMVYAPPR